MVPLHGFAEFTLCRAVFGEFSRRQCACRRFVNCKCSECHPQKSSPGKAGGRSCSVLLSQRALALTNYGPMIINQYLPVHSTLKPIPYLPPPHVSLATDLHIHYTKNNRLQ